MSQYPNPNTNERGVRHTAAHPGGGNGTYGESPASGPAPTTAGHHKHDTLNKLDPRVDSTQDRRPMIPNDVPAGTYGPHSSRLANALDPRVDSDASKAQAAQQSHGGQYATQGGLAGGVGHQGGAAMHGGTGPGYQNTSGTTGGMFSRTPASSASGYPHDGTTGVGHNSAGYGQPVGGSALGHNNHHQQQHHQQQHHQQQQQPAALGSGAGAGIMGHQSGGGVSNSHRQAAALSGPGPAPHTAGPHKSDLLNKLDPRVDSTTGAMKDSTHDQRRGI